MRAEPAAEGASQVFVGEKLLSGAERNDKLNDWNECEADLRAEPAATGAFEV